MKALKGKSASEIMAAFEKAVKKFINLPNNPKPENKGGFLRIWDRRTGELLYLLPIGIIAPEKVSSYLFFSEEKGRRVLFHPRHISSWQTRMYEQELYGGAIGTDNLVFAFSGLPEKGDEAVCLSGSLELGFIDTNFAEYVCKISGNEYFPDMLEAA